MAIFASRYFWLRAVCFLAVWLLACAQRPNRPPPPSRPPPPPPPSRPPPHVTPRRVRCTIRDFPTCFMVWQTCPSECPRSCFVDCVTCRILCQCNVAGAVCQDPRFVGGDGIAFYFHGQKDKDFCIVSDPSLHINAHFIGKRNPGMKRDFTWVQAIGILHGPHQIYVGAHKTARWDDTVDRLSLAFNGETISLPAIEGAHWQRQTAPSGGTLMIRRTRDANGVSIEADRSFKVTANVVPITESESRVHGYNITDDDCFAHLELGFKFYSLSDNVHGVLGQTYAKNYTSRVKLGASMPVLGGNREFSTSHLLATDCLASRFAAKSLPGPGAEKSSGGGMEFASMHCTSGVHEPGVVCKR